MGLIIGGFVIESFMSQVHYFLFRKHIKEYHYRLGRYLFYLMFPLMAIIFSYFFAGTKVVFIFFAFSLLGTFLEWLAGFSYHMVVGQRLWTYHRYSFGGYTSLFSAPLWGLAGVLSWFLGKLI